MKHISIGAGLLGLLFILCHTLPAAAEETPMPFVFNFTPGAQTAGPNQSVVGFRGTGFYGENKHVIGADLAILVANTKETFAGAALAGAANITGKQAYIVGLQLAGLANVNRGKATVIGFQLAGAWNSINSDGTVLGIQAAALANVSPKTDIYGVQLGLYNKARKIRGVQVGLLNYAESLRGFQLGLLNFCKSGTLLPVLPVLNFGF